MANFTASSRSSSGLCARSRTAGREGPRETDETQVDPPPAPPDALLPPRAAPAQEGREVVSEGLPRLAVRINWARQLTQNLRGHELKAEVGGTVKVGLEEGAV